MIGEQEGYLAKAEESLTSAEDDFAKGRFNSCARGAYYALFQAAVAALLHEGHGPRAEWEHAFVAARFSGVLVYRRKLYPAEFRTSLHDGFQIRARADYKAAPVSRRDALVVLEAAQRLLSLVKERVKWPSQR